MTLHADVPEFVPSSAAAPPFIPSSASLSSLAPPNEHGSTRGRKLSASSASSSHTGAGEGSTHLARSISSSSNGAGETSSQGGHARSHSVPHHSANRGGSIPRGASRGRGSGRGGSTRCGGRGGSAAGSGHGASASQSHIPVPRHAAASLPASVSQPSVKLDSVDEFPALGGGTAPAHHPTGPSTSPVHPSSSAPAAAEQTDAAATSPTAEKDAPAHSTVVESGMRKSISFARIVAPAPPSKPESSQPSSTTASSPTTASPAPSPAFAQIASNRGPRSISAESTSSASTSTTPSSGFSGHSSGRPSEQPVSPRETGLEASVSAIALSDQSKGHGQTAVKGKKVQKNQQGDMHASAAYGKDRDPLTVVPPQHNERPHFEPRHDASQRSPRLPEPAPHPPYQAQMQPPLPVQPALTPLQIAFIEQNGLAVEGLPNLAGSSFAIQSLHDYYGQPAAAAPGGPAEGGMTRSASQGQGLTKKQKKAQKAQEEQWRLYQQQQQQYYDFNAQQQGPHGQQGSQPYQPSRDRHSAPHSPNSSFHFHADAPAFTPHAHPSLHADAKEFQPSSARSKDGASLHERSPHEEPVPETQIEKLDSQDTKDAVREADAAVPDRDERNDLPNGHDPVSYDANEKPKAKDAEAMSQSAADGAEVLDAVSEDAAKPEQENPVSEHNEDVAQAQDAEIATNEQTPLELKSEQEQQEAGLPDAQTILQADEDIPDASDRDDLPAGHSQEAYDEDEQPKASIDGPATETVDAADADVRDDAPADALEATSEQEAVPQQELPNKEESEQLTDSTSALANGDSAFATSEAAQSSVSSPPHSTFSLLPPVSVEDVLDKALDFVGLGNSKEDEAKEDAEESQKAVESASSPTEAKSNLDELDLDTEDAQPDEAQAPAQHDVAEAPTAYDAKANIDKLDLPTDDVRDQEVSSSEPAVFQETDSSSLPTNDDLPSPRNYLHESSASGSTPADFDISKHSMSPSEVEESLMAPAGGATNGQHLDQELASATASSEAAASSPSKLALSIGPDWEVISSSDERCTVENGGTEVDDGEETENDDADRSTRSAAPSPQLPPSDLPKTSSPSSTRPTSIAIPPPVIVSPSSPMIATFPGGEAATGSPGSRRSSVAPVPTTPKPLADPQAGQLDRPSHTRTASESERQQAQRLVQELRSEPPTPAGEADKENIPPMQVPTTPPVGGAADVSADGEFRFDVSALGNSAKRKRSKKDERVPGAMDEDGEDDKKKRRQDDADMPDKDGAEGGDDQGGEKEAPSLTLSIFSGSIVSRKSLVLSVLASLGINILLPFVNGIMLGFGEIVARDWVGPLLGFGRRPARDEPARGLGRFSTAGLGLRGSGRGGAQDVPGNAAAKTAAETVAGEVAQAAQLE